MKALYLFALLSCLSAHAQVQPDKTTDKPDENAIYDSPALSVKPEYPGGMAAFFDFLSKNVKVPEALAQSDTSARAYFYFVIEKDGSMSNIKILRHPGHGIDKELVRVLLLMEKWTPGMHDGKKVRSGYSLPFIVTKPKALSVAIPNTQLSGDNKVFNYDDTEDKPVFPGGVDAFQKKFRDNYRIPKIEVKGPVKNELSFIIEKDGSMTNLRARSDYGSKVEQEALRVLNLYTDKWKPAEKDGTPARTLVSLPVTLNMTE